MVVLFSNNIFKFVENVLHCKILPKPAIILEFYILFKNKRKCAICFSYIKGELLAIERETMRVTFSTHSCTISKDAKTDKSDISEFMEGRNILPLPPNKQKQKLAETAKKKENMLKVN